MTSQPNQDTSHVMDFDSILSNKLQFHTKFAILSFHKVNYSNITEMIIVFVEYFQLISQILVLVFDSTINDTEFRQKTFFKVIEIICQVFNPFYFLTYKPNGDNKLALSIFYLLLSSLAIKCILLIYIILTCCYSMKAPDFVIDIWRWIFKTQGRILYFIASSFWVTTIRSALTDGQNIYGLNTRNIILSSAIIITIEYIYSLYLLMGYQYIFPTKNFLSNKSNKTQIITLTQKLILHILQAISVSNLIPKDWIGLPVCILFDLGRNFPFFTLLPLYNIKALFYQGRLLMILSSLNLSWIVQKVLINHISDNFLFPFWAISTFLTINISTIYLKRTIIKLLAYSGSKLPELLAHKISIIKQIRKMIIPPNQYGVNYNFWYLIRETINSNIKVIFNIDSKFPEKNVLNIESKGSANKIFVHYIETLLAKFPKNKLLKLDLAYYYAKKIDKYAKTVKIILELKKSNQRLVNLNSALLILDTEKAINQRYRDPNSKVNLYTYLKSQAYFNHLKKLAMKQTELQIQLCEEVMAHSPRSAKIIELAHEVFICRNEVDKKVKNMFDVIPDYFIEPLAFLAYYYLVMNHSISNTDKYTKLYTTKLEKYKKFHESEKLQNENLFQPDNAFLLLSGHKGDIGNILFCTKSVEKIYGRDPSQLIGKDLSVISPPSFQVYYTSKFKHLADKENLSNLDAIFHAYGWHKNGYIIEVDYYMNIFPFLNNAFCFSAIVRRTKANQDCLIITRNGNIEGTTQKVAAKFGLKKLAESAIKGTLNIKLLSDELSLVNRALNIKGLLDQGNDLSNDNDYGSKCLSPKLTFENELFQYFGQDVGNKNQEECIQKLRELCSIYTKEGKELVLKSYTNNKNCLYHCKISEINSGNFLRRIVSLKSISDTNGETLMNNSEKSQNDESEDFDILKLGDGKLDSPISPDANIKSQFFQPKMLFTDKLTERITTTERGKNTLFTLISEKIHTETSNLLSPINVKKYRADQNELIQVPVDTNSKKVEKQDVNNPFKAEHITNKEFVSKNLKSVNISKAFEEAIAVKSSRRYFTLFCCSFYLILACIFGIQFYIALDWKNDLQALKVKKDILNNAFLRTYYAIDLPAYLNLIEGLEAKKLELDSMGIDTDLLISYIEEETVQLNQANNILLADTNSLKEETRESLFYKDVKVFDTCSGCLEQPYITVDNYQAMNAVLELSLKLTPLVKENFDLIKEEIDVFSQNCLNDLIIKNAQISDIFLESLDDQRQEILSFTKAFLVVILGLLGINVLSVSITIWNYYFTEKQYITSFVKVSSTGVENVLIKLKNFKSLIQNQENFEQHHKDTLDGREPMQKRRSIGKNEYLKNPECKGLVRKYQFHFLKLISLITIVLGLTFWSDIAVQTFIKDIYEIQSELYFFNLVRLRINLIAHAVNDLIVNQYNRTIENKPILAFIAGGIDETIDLRSRLTKVFTTEALEKNSVIKRILYEDGCIEIYPEFEPFCSVAKANGMTTGFIQTLTIFETYLVNFYQEFSQLSEIQQSLFLVSPEVFHAFFSVSCILTGGEPFYLIEIIDKAYETMIVDSIRQRFLLFGTFTAALSILIVLLWMLAFKDLKDINNRFKKVLGTLPADVILPNFFLKNFLINNSEGALDIVKSGI